MKKTKLTPQKVRHIAKLAGLTLSPSEVKKSQKQLSGILDYVEILQRVDTKKVEPTSQVTGLKNVLRKDKAEKCLTQKETLANASEAKSGFFKTKSVKEKWS
ncbi:MAG TPA: Asp-tRNA(Asn)/Glu-tRNA(Gln) amidotransferase subunit GatC [Nevskiaceae bacterium]|nr:Asp-tRNA(Asn)/Glu-tRNA(Gln) amidotransferase subunit GatC [Nevskiaceae bacterium]